MDEDEDEFEEHHGGRLAGQWKAAGAEEGWAPEQKAILAEIGFLLG